MAIFAHYYEVLICSPLFNHIFRTLQNKYGKELELVYESTRSAVQIFDGLSELVLRRVCCCEKRASPKNNRAL